MNKRFFSVSFLSLILSSSLLFCQQNQYEHLINESKKLFSLGYYSSSLQTGLFAKNVLSGDDINEFVDSNLIKNSLRLNDVGSEKQIS